MAWRTRLEGAAYHKHSFALVANVKGISKIFFDNNYSSVGTGTGTGHFKGSGLLACYKQEAHYHSAAVDGLSSSVCCCRHLSHVH